MIFHCQAILFDMDGVLVDSTPAVERVWRKWAQARDLDAEYIIQMAHGRRSVETIRVVAPQLVAEKENLLVEQMEIEDREGVRAIPGAGELLRSLPPDRFTIVTSATMALARARLEYAGLRAPDRMVTSDDVVNGKPHPEPYLKGAELLGFPPADCLVFEDTPAGVEAAKQAGMKAVALTTTYPAVDLRRADAVLASCMEVSATFQRDKIRLELSVMAPQIQD